MATMYLMSLEDRVELARNQLDLRDPETPVGQGAEPARRDPAGGELGYHSSRAYQRDHQTIARRSAVSPA